MSDDKYHFMEAGPWPLETVPCASQDSQPISIWLKFLLNPLNLPTEERANWAELMLAVVLTILELIGSLRQHFSAYRDARNKSEGAEKIKWKAPREGLLKINFDVAVKIIPSRQQRFVGITRVSLLQSEFVRTRAPTQ